MGVGPKRVYECVPSIICAKPKGSVRMGCRAIRLKEWVLGHKENRFFKGDLERSQESAVVSWE